MNESRMLMALGGLRTGVGTALVVAPAFAGRVWVGPDADGHGSRVFARVIGARDVALGGLILAAVNDGELAAASRLARSGVVADVADVVATLVAWRNLEGARRWAMPIIAAAVGAAGALVWSVADEEVSDDEKVADRVTTTAESQGIVDQQGAALARAAATN